MVKPAAPAVMATGLYAGTTLADDGSPILLFDPAGLAQVGGVQARDAGARGADCRRTDGGRIAARRRCCCSAASTAAAERFASRSSTGSRKCRRRASRPPPASSASRSARRSCRSPARPQTEISDGQGAPVPAQRRRTRDLATPSPKSSTSRPSTVTSSTPSSPGEISGVSLINGEPAELVDAHWLFANHVGAAARRREPLVCRLPGDDPWMQNMLRPIVEAAGYRVVGDEDEEAADLVIASQGDESPEMRPSADHLAARRARSGRQEGRQHLSLRPRRAADGAEVAGAGRGK